MLRRHATFTILLVLAAAFPLLGGCGDPAAAEGEGEGEGAEGEGEGAEGEGEGAEGEGEGAIPEGSGLGPAVDRAIFPAAGETSFLTANERELLSSGTTNGSWSNGRAELGDDADAAYDEAAPSAEEGATPEPEQEADPDPNREIVEADLYKVEGDVLYLLNRYRGLVTIDLSDPDRLRVAGRLPFQAQPLEMYLRDGRAYIVMSDYFTFWQYDPDADPLGFHGSQILIVDVSDPANPLPLGSQLVDGEVTDTRMVGDVLYTVSKRNPNYWRYNTADWEDQTWVASLDVADPAHIEEVDRITFRGTSTLIHVAPHAVFVAAWDPNFYLVDPDHPQQTLITYVDISDPAGDLRERGTIYVTGVIQDKFKMDWYERTLRVMAQSRAYSSGGWLYTIDTTFPDQLTQRAALPISDERWGSLRASRYAGERAYALTSRYDSGRRTSVQELHVLDLADPAAPIESATLEVDLQATHFQVHGDRLLALGQSTRQAAGSYDWRVQLSLFDVADPGAPRLLDSERLGQGSSYSLANNDYKALRVVPELGLILVPLSWYQSTANGQSRSFNGTQIVDWAADRLTERAGIASRGQVLRVFPVGERLIAVTDASVQSIDARDRDNPVETSAVYLVRTVLELFDVQGKAVQLVAADSNGGLRFEVLPFGKEDDAPAEAVLELPFSSAPACLRDGDVIHLVGYIYQRGQVIQNADFRDPAHPRLVGDLQLSSESETIYSGGAGYYWRYWNPAAGLPLRNQILPFTVRRIVASETGRRDWESTLRLIDLRDLENPRVALGAVPMNDYAFINKVTHGDVLFSTHVEQATTAAGEGLLYHVRAYVDRIDVTDPDHPVVLPSLNVPGWLIDVNDDGSLLYTIDYQWDDFGRRRNSLNVLRVVGEQAVLVDVLPVGDQVHRALFRDQVIWLTTHKYPWWGVRGETVASRQPYTVLQRAVVDDAGRIASLSGASLPGYSFSLLDLEERTAYLASTGPYGLLVLDVADPAAPRILRAARTIGYVSRVVRHEGHIYLPLGIYGVHRTWLDL